MVFGQSIVSLYCSFPLLVTMYNDNFPRFLDAVYPLVYLVISKASLLAPCLQVRREFTGHKICIYYIEIHISILPLSCCD